MIIGKKIKEEEMRKICIWGAAELAEFVIKQIHIYFRNWRVEAIVDNNHNFWAGGKEEKNISGIAVESPSVLKRKQDIDLLIIASFRYREIYNSAVREYDVKPEKIVYVETSWPNKLQMNPRVLWECLRFRAYQPDNCYFETIVDEISKAEGELNEIGIEYHTDKASIMVEKDMFRLAHDYLRHYDDLLGSRKASISRLCELGCGCGASLKMWKDYLPETNIVGVDINPDAKKFEEEHIEIVIGNAAQKDTIDFLKERYQSFSVIIDDASHAWGDMRISFEHLWDAIIGGGVYVIEDIQCGSMGSFPEYPPVVWDSQPILNYVLDRAKIMGFGRDWNPEYNTYHFEHLPEHIKKIERELDQVMIIHGACIIKKR